MKRLRFLQFLVLTLPLLPGLAREVGAADGVIQINQARAIAGGVTAGDAPGFPVLISEDGRYILTSVLDVTGQPSPESVTAITVTASGGATIDLNGFGIKGATVCTGTPVTSCTPTGTGVGILFTSQVGLVYGGAISGMGYRGIDMSGSNVGIVRDLIVHHSGENGIVLPGSSLADRVIVTSNGGVGLLLGATSSVVGSSATYNLGNGIQADNGSQVRESASSANGDSGISMGGTGLVEECVTNGNGDAGITSGLGMTVRDSVTLWNTTDGIRVGGPSTLTHNNSNANVGDGIEAGGSSVVLGNVVSGNGGYGLNLGAGTGYQGNVVNTNTTGTVNGTGLVEMGANVCGGDSTCP